MYFQFSININKKGREIFIIWEVGPPMPPRQFTKRAVFATRKGKNIFHCSCFGQWALSGRVWQKKTKTFYLPRAVKKAWKRDPLFTHFWPSHHHLFSPYSSRAHRESIAFLIPSNFYDDVADPRKYNKPDLLRVWNLDNIFVLGICEFFFLLLG